MPRLGGVLFSDRGISWLASSSIIISRDWTGSEHDLNIVLEDWNHVQKKELMGAVQSADDTSVSTQLSLHGRTKVKPDIRLFWFRDNDPCVVAC